MPRNRSFIRKDVVFHVGNRTNNREWFDMPMPLVWQLATDLLYFTSRAFNLEVQAFVLMNNHFHMLVRAPDINLPEAMLYFQRELSKSIGRELGRINHVFGGRYTATYIDSLGYQDAVYKYIYRNPVEPGICLRVEMYPYSSLRGLLGFERMPLIIHDPLDLTGNTASVLEWLNYSFKKEQRECIRRGLRHPTFEWKTGGSRRNCWTDDLVFRTNAQGYTEVGGTL